jgi:transposase
LRLVPDESGQQPLVQRLRAVIAAKDEQIAVLAAQVGAVLERERRLELRVAELERRLSMDSSDSGTPSSKEGIGAKAARKVREKKGRQESERERSKDRKRGGQPGHQGKGLKRDPGPDDTQTAEAPAQCRSCHGSLDGAGTVVPRWAQVIDIEILRKVTEVLLPGLSCGDCGTVTYAAAPPGFHPGSVSYGPVLNGAAVLLSCFGNVPAERSARLIGMLTGQDVSSGWVDKAVARVDAGLRAAGFDEAMLAALAAEGVLAADETPVSVTDKTPVPDPGPDGEADPEEKAGKPEATGAPHVLVVVTPDGRLTFLQALGSRRKGSVGGGIPAGFAGYLMTDGYTGYQHLIGSRVKGIQQCCQHIIRRARQVQKLGPGGVQNWAGGIIAVLRDAHEAVEEARARGSTALDPQVLAGLRGRYDTAVESGRIHNRLRDWDGGGNHPGYALACWLRDYKEQVFLFTRDFDVDWTNNVSERGAKKAKRHQAVSGCWHSLATLGRWCRLSSYLDSAAAHGTAALDAVRAAIEGKPWLPPLPAVS